MIKYVLPLLVMPFFLFGKTLVFTTAFNRPDFIELQYRLFEKFLEDDYEYVVISDANTEATQASIQAMCDKLNITCHQVPQSIHDRPYLFRKPGENYNNPNVRHCNSAQWAWDNFFSHHDGPVMIIDSDMFLIRPYSIEKTLSDRHFAGVMWGTQDMVNEKPYSYLWLALIMFNNPLLVERETICFNCGYLPDTDAVCDSGGWTNLYLTKFKDQLNIHHINYVQGHHFFCPYRYASPDVQNFDAWTQDEIVQNLTARGFTENEIALVLKKPYTIEFLGDNSFIHYRAGTNYENYSQEFLNSKDEILMEFFENLLK